MFRNLLKIIFLFIVLFLMSLSVVEAKDLTSSLSIDDVKSCSDNICENPFNDTDNGVKVQERFLSKIEWSLHTDSAIESEDFVVIPFANDVVEGQSIYLGSSFSWADINDNNGNKIGRWRVQGSGRDRVIRMEFSDDSIGKTDIRGTFVTPKSMYVSFMYSDNIFPFTVGDNIHYLKVKTIKLNEAGDLSGISNTDSSNNHATIIVTSPKFTIKQLYNTDKYPTLTNAAILNNLYCELLLPKELNVASISNLSITSGVALPTSLNENKVSTSFYYSSVMNFFTEINQEENESYSHFKDRLGELEYGIYTDDNENKTIVINYGSLPSSNLTYQSAIFNLDSSVSEPGDYWHNRYPLTVDSVVKNKINTFLGSENIIDGRIASWGLYITLRFSPVVIETNKKINSIWSWKNASGEVKTDQRNIDVKLVVPSAIASIIGSSQLLLRDYKSGGQIVGAKIKLQKKNGNDFEDIGEEVTDDTGMVMFRNLDDGTYRYIQTEFLPHYRSDSFISYSDSSMNNVITTFDFDKNEGNIIYATNEYEKYTISFLPGDHGDFETETSSEYYGDPTPDYTAIGKDAWRFNGWSPEKSPYVLEDAEYIATWKKDVKVTAKYLEYGTDNVLSSEVIDINDNETSYTTSVKVIQNYEFYSID